MSERRQGPGADDAEGHGIDNEGQSVDSQGFSTNPAGPPSLVACLHGLSCDIPACNCGSCHHEECIEARIDPLLRYRIKKAMRGNT
jgi:hypothetical protein